MHEAAASVHMTKTHGLTLCACVERSLLEEQFFALA
jgi:hypothetical protein